MLASVDLILPFLGMLTWVRNGYFDETSIVARFALVFLVAGSGCRQTQHFYAENGRYGNSVVCTTDCSSSSADARQDSR